MMPDAKLDEHERLAEARCRQAGKDALGPWYLECVRELREARAVIATLSQELLRLKGAA